MTSLLAIHWVERKIFSLKSVSTKICLNLDVVIDPKDWVYIKNAKDWISTHSKMLHIFRNVVSISTYKPDMFSLLPRYREFREVDVVDLSINNTDVESISIELLCTKNRNNYKIY